MHDYTIRPSKLSETYVQSHLLSNIDFSVAGDIGAAFWVKIRMRRNHCDSLLLALPRWCIRRTVHTRDTGDRPVPKLCRAPRIYERMGYIPADFQHLISLPYAPNWHSYGTVRQNVLVNLLDFASPTEYHSARGRQTEPHRQPRSSVASVTASVRPVCTHAVTGRESEIGSERFCRSTARCKSATLVPTGPIGTRMNFWVILGHHPEAVVGLKSAVTTAHPPTRHLSLTLVVG